MGEAVEVDVIANDKASPAWKQQADMVHAYLRELASLDRVQKENEKSAKAYDAAARKAIEEGRTPLERYNARVGELKGLLNANKLSQDQFNRSVAVAKTEMDAAGKSGVSVMSGLGGQLTSLVGGYASLTAGVQLFRQANEEAMKEAQDAATKQDDLVRRFRAQAGLSEIAGNKAKADIYAVGEAVAASPEAAFGAATSLVSTGFSTDEAKGASLKPFMKLIAAQALDPKKATSAGDMAENFSQFLSATGQDKTGGNVEKLAVAIQSLKATPLKVTDLAQLSKQAAGLKEMGRMSPEEMLSNFAYLRNTLSDETAGQGMREVVKNLAIAGSRKDRVEVLKSMGLTGGDVDFVGEDLQTILGRVQGGLQKLPEGQRAGALDKLVEGANVATFQLMAKGQGEVAALRAGLGDVAGFEADVAIGTSGRNAASRRQASRRERKIAERNTNRDLYGGAVEEAEIDAGTSDVQRKFRRMFFDTLTGLGVSPETAAGVTSGTNIIGGGSNAETTNKILQSVADDMKGMREDLRNEAAKPKKFEAKTDPTPARPVPAAALGRAG